MAIKILQLTKKFPYPLKDGESIAVSTLTRSLSKMGCEYTLLSMNTIKHHFDVQTLPDSYDFYKEIYTVDLDNRIKPLDALTNLFSSESYHVSRFYYQEFKDKLIQLLQENDFDIIQLETLYLAPYINDIRKYTAAPIVMRSHNVEYEIWSRITANTTNPLKKWYLKYLTNKLERFEKASLTKYDYLLTVTQRDFENYQKILTAIPGESAPIGLQLENYIPAQIKPNEKKLSFIGSLDWMPNLEGLEWFLKEVFPLVLAEESDVEIHIAGRNTPQNIFDLQSKNVIIHGEVEDAKAFLNNYPISVVPLLSGSGMRVKILEAMALGRVVVSTSIGAEGILAKNSEEIFIEDDELSFAKTIINLLQNPDTLSTVHHSARSFIENHFDQDKNAWKVKEVFENLLNVNNG